MSIPLFDQTTGLLPDGIFDCTLAEISSVLCFTPRRTFLFGELGRFLQTEVPKLQGVGTVYIDGSFARSKPDPDDIDIVIDISAGTQQETEHSFLAIYASHERWKTDYAIDVYSYHPILPLNLVSFFQYAGVKAAAELRINPKHPKGILRLL